MSDELPDAAREFFRRKGREGGLLSKDARMKKLTPAKRRKVAQIAAKASAEARRKAKHAKP